MKYLEIKKNRLLKQARTKLDSMNQNERDILMQGILNQKPYEALNQWVAQRPKKNWDAILGLEDGMQQL